MNAVNEKLVEIVQLLAGHYDIGFSSACNDIWKMHMNTNKAEYAYNEQLGGLDAGVKEAFRNYLEACSKESELKEIYAYLAGLKHGICLGDWIKSDDLPFSFERMGNRDYAEHNSRESFAHN